MSEPGFLADTNIYVQGIWPDQAATSPAVASESVFTYLLAPDLIPAVWPDNVVAQMAAPQGATFATFDTLIIEPVVQAIYPEMVGMPSPITGTAMMAFDPPSVVPILPAVYPDSVRGWDVKPMQLTFLQPPEVLVPLPAIYPQLVHGPSPVIRPTMVFPPVFTDEAAVLGIVPNEGNIRGGWECFVYCSHGLADTLQDDDLLRTTLPSGWFAMNIGGTSVSTAAGLVLATTTPMNDVAMVEAQVTGIHFDLRVTVEPLMVLSTLARRAAQLEVIAGPFSVSSNIFAVDGALRGVSEVAINGAIQARGAVALEWGPVELRVVIGGNRYWLFVDETLMTQGALPGLEDLHKTPRLASINSASVGGLTRVRFTDWKVRSGAAVDGQLIADSTFAFDRIVGTMPAAAEGADGVGDVLLEAFGPWGRATDADGFRYTLPPTKDAQDGTAQLRLATDKVIRGHQS